MTSRLKNVHLGLASPGSARVTLVKGDYEYWHYCCDGCDDRGWGCGYRTLQTVCSWVRLQCQHQQKPEPHVLGNNIPQLLTLHTQHAKSFGNDVISVIASGDVSSDEFGGVCEVAAVRDDAHTDVLASGYGKRTEMSQNSKTSLNAKEESSNCAEEIIDSVELSNAKTDRHSGNCISVAAVVSQDSPDNEWDSFGITVVSSGNQNSSDNLPSVPPSATINKRDLSHVDSKVVQDVPSLLEIQSALVRMGDKSGHFVGSRQWIGSYEVCLCLDFFYDVPCKIVHIKQGADLGQHLSTLQTHFSALGSPVMMGGDSDASSKGIMGVCMDPAALLVVDPHYSGEPKSAQYLQQAGWVKWILLDDFHPTSFYNICLPQLAAKPIQ